MAGIALNVNGRPHRVDADPSTPLLIVLRNHLGLTGAKIGCGLEQCGACAVLVDGTPTLTCAAPVASFEHREIVTVEGLCEDGAPGRVQRAFIEAGAAQCGYCTPGLVVAVAGLMRADPRPGEAEIRRALSRHLCRCGSHARVLAAARRLCAQAVPR